MELKNCVYLKLIVIGIIICVALYRVYCHAALDGLIVPFIGFMP